MTAAGERITAVWQIHRRRDGRGSPGGRAYGVYLIALAAALYVVPAGVLVARELGTIGRQTAESDLRPVALACVAACWLGALVLGRFWGPLVMPPFVLHVLQSTDLPPPTYLTRVARRRIIGASLVVTLLAVLLALGINRAFGRIDVVVVSVASALLTGVIAGSCWLIGQLRSGLVVATTGAALLAVSATALVVDLQPIPLATLVAQGASPSVGSDVLLGLAQLAAVAALVGWAAHRAIMLASPDRLARESTRAAQALVFTGTGTFHDALALYRPRPAGLRHALLRHDGRLRGPVAHGVVRALRTPVRAGFGLACLLAGSTLASVGTAWSGAADGLGPTSTWTAGAVLVYLGAGWISETWRSLRDELYLPALLGGRDGGAAVRHTTWPILASLVTGLVGWSASHVLLEATDLARGGPDVAASVLMALTVVVALAARFLREMKVQLPVETLTPIVTPFGDLSGLRVLAWQFDGLLTVMVSVAVLGVATPGSGVIVVAAIAGTCLWWGLERVDRAPWALLLRLRYRTGRTDREISRC
ncbi:hypothetical protein GCM10009710_09350 [Aeromicrobium alkaliterrae]|uniref:ABC transporter permease n=2 Tax=Aeromicrobium alkaliterrae TaxID=302168 RepID=A0ABN2JL25_9ACTN